MLIYWDLSELERRLWDAIALGTAVGRRFGDPERDDPACGAAWGEERCVRAEFLIDLVTSGSRPSGQPPRALRLNGARVTGKLDLEALTLACPLALCGCYFVEPVTLDEARASSIRLSGCHILSLGARQLETRGDLALDELTAKEGVDLAGARVGGELNLDGATLVNSSGEALDADGLSVVQGMFCRRLTAQGRMHLPRAHVGGQLNFDGATLVNSSGEALRADRLRVVQGMFCRDGFTADGEVRLPRGDIGGQASFRGAKLRNGRGCALYADGLRVDQGMSFEPGQREHGPQQFLAEGEMRLVGAHIRGRLSFDGAQLTNECGWALNADRLQVDQDMLCRKKEGCPFVAEGGVSLLGARIGVQLSFNGAQLGTARRPGGQPRATPPAAPRLEEEGGPSDAPPDPGEAALNADGLEVDHSMFCREGFVARGQLRLLGAHIGGQLSFDGAHLVNAGGRALSANRLEVDESMLCRWGFEAQGEMQLLGAHIGSRLDLSGAQLKNPDGCALNAARLRIDQDMICGEGFTAQGGVRLLSAHIGGQLDLCSAQLTNPDGRTPNLERTEAAESRPSGGHLPHGVVDLTDARVGQLRDVWPPPPKSDPVPYRPRLAGFVFESLAPDSDDRAARLDWLAHADDGYQPQAYDQLVAVFRRAGREDDARWVAIEKRRRLRSQLDRHGRHQLDWRGRQWNRFLAWTVGYGYRTWLAVLWLAGFVLAGWIIFALSWPGRMRPLKAKDQLPDFHPWLYSLDTVLPVVRLGQEEFWAPNGIVLWWYVASVVAGWVLVTAALAALTAAAVRR